MIILRQVLMSRGTTGCGKRRSGRGLVPRSACCPGAARPDVAAQHAYCPLRPVLAQPIVSTERRGARSADMGGDYRDSSTVSRSERSRCATRGRHADAAARRDAAMESCRRGPPCSRVQRRNSDRSARAPVRSLTAPIGRSGAVPRPRTAPWVAGAPPHAVPKWTRLCAASHETDRSRFTCPLAGKHRDGGGAKVVVQSGRFFDDVGLHELVIDIE
jgi:hypothetical protein